MFTVFITHFKPIFCPPLLRLHVITPLISFSAFPRTRKLTFGLMAVWLLRYSLGVGCLMQHPMQITWKWCLKHSGSSQQHLCLFSSLSVAKLEFLFFYIFFQTLAVHNLLLTFLTWPFAGISILIKKQMVPAIGTLCVKISIPMRCDLVEFLYLYSFLILFVS